MRSAIRGRFSSLATPARAPRVIAGVPITLYAAQVVGTVVVGGTGSLTTAGVLPGLVMHAAFVAATVWGARRLARNDLDPARYPRLLGWYVGGLAAFLAINLALMAVFPLDTLVQNVGWVAFAANMGAGGGLVVGWTEARAIDRAAAAERDAAEAEFLAAQRDRFEYMNALLRHEVLNNVQVIRGQAEYLLTEDRDPEVERRLEIISRQSDDMADVVEDVRVVSEGLENTDLEAIDLQWVLRTELTDLRDSHDEVETDLDCPDDVAVLGDSLLPRVFGNLLSNAVEHNDADVARVSVTVETAGDSVAVAVADNGPGVPAAVRGSLFDRSKGPHGVGLYLVDTLVTHYGGDVELAESGPDGSVFRVELERADDSGRAHGHPADSRRAFDPPASVASDGGE